MRAHEEAEWTGLGVNPELLNQLAELAEVAVKMLHCVPLQHRAAITATLIDAIHEGSESIGAVGAQKH